MNKEDKGKSDLFKCYEPQLTVMFIRTSISCDINQDKQLTKNGYRLLTVTINFQIYYKDGKDSAVDEFGNEAISMEVERGTISFWITLQILMNIWTLNHLNASKRVYGDDIKEHFFCLIYEKGLTAGKAGKQLNISRRTAYNWFEKNQKESKENASNEGKFKAGRPDTLNNEHQAFLKRERKDSPSATLDQAMESLTNEFKDLEVSKSAVHRFKTEK
ncbi:hypothetical protein BCV71DRAFT_255285 [Rhizopus microsporus]|uniref:Uncharacterized protein n=1 Tax=Rhizopus microsporus TaxID=58291 RepID=A0A1X0S331_RHIZD|nr:hypothetical protein BCV71DRAFT_255285 [Rhizopus microsporus]